MSIVYWMQILMAASVYSPQSPSDAVGAGWGCFIHAVSSVVPWDLWLEHGDPDLMFRSSGNSLLFPAARNVYLSLVVLITHVQRICHQTVPSVLSFSLPNLCKHKNTALEASYPVTLCLVAAALCPIRKTKYATHVH